ncbi:hypothetical protein GGR26_001566 [Lewinella marina]|uniref:Linalool dehydratase/isomerase domain-containing protein n=1 Tax=Neolewinella marina TaxID=438751 RepID=A0A2G0CF10_9BACT|nr:hypothetical protein [Neolewinella marina]NJB85821.1 hypothetical protein [Neolewinella marina]PHK98510.1 hypothetical protein CGL56_08510 [Neolewinella marina]
MSVTGLLPPLLFSLAFLLPAWWLYRNGRKGWALAPACTALILVVVTLAIYRQEVTHRQARHDLRTLLTELDRKDLYSTSDLREVDETLFFFSAASQALYRGLGYAPEQRDSIGRALKRMADWSIRYSNLTQWGPGADWDREVFFMAHAGSVLGHYQLATNDEAYAPYFQRIGRYLAGRMIRGHYKHLISRPDESLLRPADNAAAIYTLSLYDEYYGEGYAVKTRQQWTDYIDKELHYAESRLPCAGFTTTNRCALEPSAAATGLYICYRAAASPEEVTDDIPYREWLHYFKRFSGNPFSLSVRPNMRDGEVARLCNAGLAPLECGQYEDAIGLWAAAEYGGGYTYFRLFSGAVIERWFGEAPDFSAMRAARRVKVLTEVALRAIGEGELNQ